MTDFSAYITTKDDPEAIRCSGGDGRNSYYYRVPQGRSEEDLAVWFAGCCESETGQTHYPRKVSYREYEFVTDLGTPPKELLDASDAAESDQEIMDAEDALAEWYAAREIELLKGV